MIKHTEVMKQALEALEIERNVPRLGPVPTKTSKAITALREALTSVPDWASEAKEQPAPVAKPRKQEPPTVAELVCVCGAEWEWRNRDWELVATPPAQRTWVGLTDEDKCTVELAQAEVDPEWIDGYKSGLKDAEATLKEKNV